MFKKILVPLDGSELSEAALAYAQDLAHCYEARLYLLRVMQPVNSPTVYITANNVIRDAKLEALNFAHGRLENLANKIRAEGIDVVANIFRGFPYVEILRYVDKNKIDLIVVTAHGFSAITHRLFGSVVDKVLLRTSIPVLLVRDVKTK
jgi:nucleotide-binding universal stress UspA family protein